MSNNTSDLAQEDVKQALDRAVQSEKGVRITFKSGSPEANSAVATATRARMHRVRVLDRKNSTAIYPADHPMHGRSSWDILFIQKVANSDGSAELRITKGGLANFILEDL